LASVRWQVVEAVQAAIQALDLPTPSGRKLPDEQVMIRKKAEHDSGFEAQPSIVLVSQKEQPGEETFGNRLFTSYPVLVLLVQERSLRPESVRYEADTRELIRLVLWKPQSLPGVVQRDTDYDPQPSVDVSSWGGAFDVSAQLFTFEVSENRSG
jgi:hypothetical protein